MRYSSAFRIWHWLNAVVVLGLLGTVFLRKTFLSWRTNSEILMTKLSEFGIEITSEQAASLAKAIRAGMWEWHIIFGYMLAFLLIYRVVLFFYDTTPRESFGSLTLHKKAVQLLYYLFYVTIAFMAVSGFLIHFYQDLGLSKDAAHDIKEIHELVFNFIMYFTALHIAGVVIADMRDEKGLISSMINGEKNT